MFTFMNREPLHFDRCWKFDDENGVSPCQAGRIDLKVTNGAWEICKAPTAVMFPAVTYEIHNEMHELKLQLLSGWGGSGYNQTVFSEWLKAKAIVMDSAKYWRCFVESKKAMYMIQFTLDRAYAPTQVSATIFAYNKDFVTDSPMAARLVEACKFSATQPGYIADLTFAKAVCEDLRVHLGDAPAIQASLDSAIKRLEKMTEV